jgi:hypothetical protein
MDDDQDINDLELLLDVRALGFPVRPPRRNVLHKPWLAEGISRATWYRREQRKAAQQRERK